MRKLTFPVQNVFATFLGADVARDTGAFQVRRWRPEYWLFAGIFPVVLFAFTAAKISLYHVARAPNVGLIAQLAFTFAFYMIWIGITRLIWWVIAHELGLARISYQRLALRLSGLGLLLSSGHLFLRTLSHVVMNATAAWAWQPIHLLHVYGAIWLGYAIPWALAFAATAVFILVIMAQPLERRDALKRFEVKQNGKLMSIPLAQIYWFKAAGNYAELYTEHGVFTVRKTLSQVAKHIGEAGFLKSHRGALVNASLVVAIKPDAGRSGYVVLFSNGEQAPLSRRKLSEFRNRLSLTE